MLWQNLPLLLLISIIIVFKSYADPQQAMTIIQQNSKCKIIQTTGEYPAYVVQTQKRADFKPKSDGIVKAVISPSGKYAALSAGEISLIDIEPNKFEFGIVILNCETGKIKGYHKNIPTLIKSFSDDDKKLNIFDGSPLVFAESENALP